MVTMSLDALLPPELKTTTLRRRRMMRRRMMTMKRWRSMTARSLSRSWSRGVAGVWWETQVFASSRGRTAARRKRTRTRRTTTKSTTCTGRTATPTAQCCTKTKTRMKMRRTSPHRVRLNAFIFTAIASRVSFAGTFKLCFTRDLVPAQVPWPAGWRGRTPWPWNSAAVPAPRTETASSRRGAAATSSLRDRRASPGRAESSGRPSARRSALRSLGEDVVLVRWNAYFQEMFS